MNTTDDLRALSASVLFAVGGFVCMVLLWAAVQCKPGIRIFLLKLRKHIGSNLVDLCLRYGAIRQAWHNLFKQSLDNAKSPLTHDERFRDIDSSNRDGHNSGFGLGGDFVIRALNWPGLYVVFPGVARQKGGEKTENETAERSKSKVAELEIPARLKLWPPSQILASGALDDSAEPNVSNINRLPTLGTIEIIPDSLRDTNGGTINESWQDGIRHDGGGRGSANSVDGSHFCVFCHLLYSRQKCVFCSVSDSHGCGFTRLCRTRATKMWLLSGMGGSI